VPSPQIFSPRSPTPAESWCSQSSTSSSGRCWSSPRPCSRAPPSATRSTQCARASLSRYEETHLHPRLLFLQLLLMMLSIIAFVCVCDCVQKKIVLNTFLDALMADPPPQCLVWLPLMHRLANVENGEIWTLYFYTLLDIYLYSHSTSILDDIFVLVVESKYMYSSTVLPYNVMLYFILLFHKNRVYLNIFVYWILHFFILLNV